MFHGSCVIIVYMYMHCEFITISHAPCTVNVCLYVHVLHVYVPYSFTLLFLGIVLAMQARGSNEDNCQFLD